MFDNNLRTPTYLWVEAKVKELNAQNIASYILHRGEKMDGMIYIKIADCRSKARLITQERDLDGVMQWVDLFGDGGAAEGDIDAYIQKTLTRDPDMWVIEIEKADMQLTL